MKKKAGKVIAVGAAAAAAGVLLKKMRDGQKKQETSRIESIEEAVMNNRDYGEKRAYLVGGGLATMAAAAYLIRDCKFPGDRITIYEGMHILGAATTGSAIRNMALCAAADVCSTRRPMRTSGSCFPPFRPSASPDAA